MDEEEAEEFSILLESTLQSMLDAMDEGALVFDTAGTCRVVGRRVGELFGHEPASLLGRTRLDTLRLLAQSADEPDTFLASVAVNDLDMPAQSHGEHELATPRPRFVVWSSYPLVHEGKRRGRLCLVRDVTGQRSAERARAALQRRLDNSLPTDPLTGLANKRRFHEDLEREHQRAARSWDSYAILCVDIDKFTAINEGYGQPVGDTVLEEVATTLKRARREYDVIARLEDDTFALLLPGADIVAAEAVSERLALGVQELVVVDGLGISVCVGAAVWQPGSRDKGTDVLRHALVSLERARARSPSTVAVETSLRTVPPGGPVVPARPRSRPPSRA